MNLFSFLMFFFLFSGCSSVNRYNPQENPPALPTCYMPERIRVALILGSGGAKGIAHIGVIEELEKANIPIDLIVGCSAGSIVGALYADNPDSQAVRKILEPMKRNTILDINIWKARWGLSQGRSLQKTLRKNLCAKQFHHLQIPLIVVATDLNSGELIPIGGGDIIPAVQASCAIPFVFVPVSIHGRVLVDGGVADPVPVQVARKLGAEFVIAVDLQGLLTRTFPTNLFGVAKRSAEIAFLWQSRSCGRQADVLIEPQVEGFGTFDDTSHRLILEAGRRAAREMIPLIKERLSAMQDFEESSCVHPSLDKDWCVLQ